MPHDSSLPDPSDAAERLVADPASGGPDPAGAAAPPSLPADLPAELVREVASAYGLGSAYQGHDGDLHAVEPSTLVAVLRTFGVELHSAEDARAALRARHDAPWRRTLPPVSVVRESGEHYVQAHVPHGEAIELMVRAEDGGEVPAQQVEDWSEPRELDGDLIGQASFRLPRLPIGWHTLVARTPSGTAEAPLVVTPDRLTTHEALGGRAGWGLQTQLYSVRSLRSWGVGDLADLRDLGVISAAEYGADFSQVNPLHAAQPVPPMEASPYLPATRRFVSPLYLRIEDVPEYAYMTAAARRRIKLQHDSVKALNLDASLIDRDRVLAAKNAALEELVVVPLTTAREIEFEAYREREGRGLEDFALWCAIREQHDAGDPAWEELSSPVADAAVDFRAEHADRVRFHCWVQWLLDEQLAQAQEAARAAGMRIGIMHDLAVGVHPHGADAWATGDVLARGVGVGAPADQYNQLGQNWHQPPWRPDLLAEAGYAPFRDMIRTLLRHAGALRIDHILGLFRLWWIPEGAEAKDGCYVTYDHEAMIGILALEAQRADAIVIGEDLGTFEPWVRDYLAERGIMGTSILWFENDGEQPIPPEQYRTMCLASVNTHDLPPTAGYLTGEHIRLRSELGLLDRPAEEERELDEAAQGQVLDQVRARGRLTEGDADVDEVVCALHGHLAQAPSLLLGVALVDCVGEHRIQNQPGTSLEYPNWRIPLADAEGRPVLLDELPAIPLMHRLVAALRQGAGAGA